MSERPETTTLRVYSATADRFRKMADRGGFSHPDLMRLVIDDIDESKLRSYIERRLAESDLSPTVSGNGVSEAAGRGLPAPAAAPDAPARRSA